MIKQIGLISVLLLTLSLTFHVGFQESHKLDKQYFHNYYVLGEWVGSYEGKKLVQQVEPRIEQAQKTQEELEKVKKERDKAIAAFDRLEDTIFACGNGTCKISSTFRAASWKLTHAGLWNKFLDFGYARAILCHDQTITLAEGGHSLFVFEDSDGTINAYTDTTGTYILGHIQKDPKVIAQAFLDAYAKGQLVLIDAEFEN